MEEVQAGLLLFRFLRFCMARKQLKVLKKKYVKRNHLLKEVLSTEEAYVGSLEVLVGVRVSFFGFGFLVYL